jgi:hypothetical protein
VGGKGVLSLPRAKKNNLILKISNPFCFVFNFVWLTGPGIFGGNCQYGNFKGKYAGRVGRQDWKSLKLNYFFLPVAKKVPLSHPRVFPKCPRHY